MERRQLRRSLAITAFFMSLVLLILVLAFSRNPHWREPVSHFDTTGGSSVDELSRDTGDSLPQIDWSWKTDKSSSSSWWPSSISPSPKIGSKAWLDRYPDFVHGPAPRQVSCCGTSLSSSKTISFSWAGKDTALCVLG